MNYVMVSYSDNRMETWSHEMRHPLIAVDGKTILRIKINRLGSAVERVLRIRYTGSTSFTLIEANALIEVGV